ncbi:MAG: XisI protein [Chloroflexota bacterium]
MDTIDQYRQIVRNLLQQYAAFKSSRNTVKAEVIIDPAKDHYQLLYIGWDGSRRVHDIAIHIEITGDKVWLQRDNTDLVVAEDLVEMGVPRDVIVLGFRPSQLRQYTGYAVA